MQSIEVPEVATVSSILEVPRGAKALLVLAHGAGAGMRHAWMGQLVQVLHERSIATLRYQFPYMEQGKKRTDSPKIAAQTVAAAVRAGRAACPKLPIYAGGKSFGGRMTTTAAAEGLLDGVQGICCFGFPLHPADKPGTKRAEHLAEVRIPTLFLQGDRDALADLALLKPVVAKHKKWIRLVVIRGADHGFAVLKSSGRTGAEVLAELADTFVKNLS